ncbi:AgrD family cyclic lactone autoinducer peptide [Erwinia sp. MMLR14_017]
MTKALLVASSVFINEACCFIFSERELSVSKISIIHPYLLS